MLKEDISRRDLLINTGKLALGAGVLAASSGLVFPHQAGAAAAKYPWGYKKLDPVKVGAITYENWYKGFCCYAVASGIIIPLQEAVGGPYKSLPLEAFVFGHGGTVGWGTLCGSLLGAGLALSFAAGKPGEEILNEVIHWYTETELPIYKPTAPKAGIKNVNTSGSPLCHISVGKWMKKENVKFFSPERKERCARLSADVAMHTVTLLNGWADGKFKAEHAFPVKTYNITSQHNCTECHGTDIPQPAM